MSAGPLWWWILGWLLIVAAGAVPIMTMPATDPVRRWVAAVFAVVLIGYFMLLWKAVRSRMRGYRAELARDGLSHGQPAP